MKVVICTRDSTKVLIASLSLNPGDNRGQGLEKSQSSSSLNSSSHDRDNRGGSAPPRRYQVVNIYFLPSKLYGSSKSRFLAKINCSQMKLPNFVNSSADSSSKNVHDFSNKVVQKLKLSKNYFHKNYFAMKKNSERFECFLT